MRHIFSSMRLGFRGFSDSDADTFLLHHNEDKYKLWFPDNECVTIEDALKVIAFFSDCINNKRLPYVLAIDLLETNELIGDVGVNEVAGKNNEIEIGFSISERFERLGYASEALSMMVKYIVPLFSIKNLYGRVLFGNEASVNVLYKCGFEYQNKEMDAEDDPYGNGMLVFVHTE